MLDASTSPPKERYAVSNGNVSKLIQPGSFDGTLLAQAVEAEVADFLAKHAGPQD
jgi:putative transposase